MNTPLPDNVHQEGDVIVVDNRQAPVETAPEMSVTSPDLTRDEVFDQLMDESRVVTGGTGSRLPTPSTTSDADVTGYSAGVGSGSGDN